MSEDETISLEEFYRKRKIGFKATFFYYNHGEPLLTDQNCDSELIEKMRDFFDVRDEMIVKEIVQTSLELGHRFENYIVHLKGDTTTLEECAPDRYSDGIAPEGIKNPDLVFSFLKEKKTVHYAVECKWRSQLISSSLNLGEKLKKYKEFALKRIIQVFIALGIGGKPDNPDKLFIIPLRDIKNKTIKEKFIRKYARSKKGHAFVLRHLKRNTKITYPSFTSSAPWERKSNKYHPSARLDLKSGLIQLLAGLHLQFTF